MFNLGIAYERSDAVRESKPIAIRHYKRVAALGVECQQVVHRKHESGEGRTIAESGVRAMPVVVVQPG